MEETTIWKIVIGIVLFGFWIYVSGALIANPSLTISVVPLSYGMFAIVSIVIQLVLKESMQKKMKLVLDSEIKERKEELLSELRVLVSYLEKTKMPSYSESGVEGLEDNFREFDSIKSKYTFQPKIIKATILLALSSLILAIFWINPTLVMESQDYPDLTLAHIGLGFLAIALWMILGILVTSLKVRIWEKEEKRITRQRIAIE